MRQPDLSAIHHDYLACLNRRDWTSLGNFVAGDVAHNDRPIGLSGYRGMLERDVRDMRDLRFDVERPAIEPPVVASRLRFTCRPAGSFLGLPINGREVTFTENAFYRFRDGKIARV